MTQRGKYTVKGNKKGGGNIKETGGRTEEGMNDRQRKQRDREIKSNKQSERDRERKIEKERNQK